MIKLLKLKIKLLIFKLLAPKLRSNVQDLFFMVSAGRSGSTSLRVSLEQSPDFVIVPETDTAFEDAFKYFVRSCFFRKWEDVVKNIIRIYQQGKHWDVLDLDEVELKKRILKLGKKERTFGNILYCIYDEYRIKNKKSALLVGEKNPYLTFFMDYLIVTFPKAKFIHIVRDGRGVVLSWKKSLNKYNDIYAIAARWNFILNTIKRLKKSINASLIEIKYEEYVNNPEEELSKVCTFLNVEYKATMVKRSEGLSSDLLQKHHLNSLNSVNTNSINRWRNGFDTGTIKALTEAMLTNLKYYKYETNV